MLGAHLAWASYSTILLPTLVENVVAERKGLVVGLIGFFGALLAVIVSILWGIISYFGMQFFTNMGNGAWWPLLVDTVLENQRSLASGIQGVLTLVGAAVGILVVTELNQNGQTGSALWMVRGVLALTGIINDLVIRGKDRPADPSQQISVYRAFRDIFKVRTRVKVFF
jgi:MFS family permease